MLLFIRLALIIILISSLNNEDNIFKNLNTREFDDYIVINIEPINYRQNPIIYGKREISIINYNNINDRNFIEVFIIKYHLRLLFFFIIVAIFIINYVTLYIVYNSYIIKEIKNAIKNGFSAVQESQIKCQNLTKENVIRIMRILKCLRKIDPDTKLIRDLYGINFELKITVTKSKISNDNNNILNIEHIDNNETEEEYPIYLIYDISIFGKDNEGTALKNEKKKTHPIKYFEIEIMDITFDPEFYDNLVLNDNNMIDHNNVEEYLPQVIIGYVDYDSYLNNKYEIPGYYENSIGFNVIKSEVYYNSNIISFKEELKNNSIDSLNNYEFVGNTYGIGHIFNTGKCFMGVNGSPLNNVDHKFNSEFAYKLNKYQKEKDELKNQDDLDKEKKNMNNLLKKLDINKENVRNYKSLEEFNINSKNVYPVIYSDTNITIKLNVGGKRFLLDREYFKKGLIDIIE